MSSSTEKETPETEIRRSVVNYVDENELRDALKTVTPQGIAKNDWILPVPDPEAEEQSMDGELERLLTLKSYMLLDAENEEAFDKLTEEAREIFGVPTSLISLIDLGRQFLFSNTGAGGVRETTRDVAFCSHTILNKKGILVVENATEDDRFKNNPFVTEDSHLRFYAGAPLISPEGHKLGTFCVEGPEPRRFTAEDQKKLKEYAAKTMEMMVERRKNLRDKLAGASASDEHLRHAAVTTNLGDTMFLKGDSVTAMQLFQESVQTIMQSQEDDGKDTKKPCDGRHKQMVELMKELLESNISEEKTKDLMAKVKALVVDSQEAAAAVKQGSSGLNPVTGIPGLFNSVTKLKGVSAPRPLPPLVFSETFTIDLSKTKDSVEGENAFPLDERSFTVSIGECSKATLFNMGLIHYHWSRPDTALQFFHLAASVSHKISPVQFDPVDLTSVGNMAQIHLLLRKPGEAMSMLEQTLKRANATLSTIYKSVKSKAATNGEDEEAVVASLADDNDEAARKTRRLRRKIARTLLDIGHVHFFNSNLDAAMASCKEAMTLVDEHMTGVTMAAVWYNMSMVLHHQRKNEEALACLDKFIDTSSKLMENDHIQRGDAMHLKGEILFDMGNQGESVEALKEALRIRGIKFGENSGILVETLTLLGKAQLALGQVDSGIKYLEQCLDIERKTSGSTELTFEAAQCIIDLARGYQLKGDVEAALLKYLDVIGWARSFFGANHAFTARIANIIGNLYSQTGKEIESKMFLQEAAQISSSA